MMKLLLFILFFSLANCKNLTNFILCEEYLYNCNNVLVIYKEESCDSFISNIQDSYTIKHKPITITKTGVEILLLLQIQHQLCNTLTFETTNGNIAFTKYSYKDFFQDYNYLLQKDLKLQLEVYFLARSFNFTTR